MQDLHRYDDMLHLPHHISPTRLPMSRLNRAAQFAPFDALSGYSAAIRETARQTETKIELDESAKQRLNTRLKELLRLQERHPEVTATWFQPDDRKDGGTYITACGSFQKLDAYRGLLVLDTASIPIEDLCRLDCDCFPCWDDLA